MDEEIPSRPGSGSVGRIAQLAAAGVACAVPSLFLTNLIVYNQRIATGAGRRGAGETMVTAGKTVRAARARERFVASHAELREVLDHWAGALAAAADGSSPVRPVRNLLRAFLIDEVLPHARAEERTLYRAVRRDPDAALLVQVLISEHRLLASMAGRLGESTRPAEAAAHAAAISALFASHIAKEESLLLPALERSGADLPAMIGREPRLAVSQCAA